MAPVLLALAIWLTQQRPQPSLRRTARWGQTAATVVLVGGILSWQWPIVTDRLMLAWQETQLHAQNGTTNTSVGQRLAHWKLAWEMGSEKPLTGWGETGYQSEKQARASRGEIPALLANFGHAHNEWLEMWAKHGALGLLALGLLLGVPGWIYAASWRRARTASIPHADLCQRASVCGLVLVIGYFGFGMTQVMLAHNSGVMMYLFMNSVFLGLISASWVSSSAQTD